MTMMREVVLVAGCRTAQGSFGGALRDVPAHELAMAVIVEVIKRAGIDANIVNTVVAGQVYQSSEALNIGRFAALSAGLPSTVSGASINVACCSSLEAFNTAAREIACGDAEVAIALGVESMSGAPFRVTGHRWGTRRGHTEIIDQLEESTWSASSYRYGRVGMGMSADHIANVYKISREEQDEYALRSQMLTAESMDKGYFRDEIVPYTVKRRKGDLVFSIDEHPRRDTTLAALAQLPAAFVEGGTVTAGNTSGINDGAAAVLLMTREKAAALGLKPFAKVRSMGRAAVDPRLICMSPGPAGKVVVDRAGLKVADIGWWEINEAFSSVVLSSCKELGIGLERVNLEGGGIALGHPVGCSGARTLVTMMYAMRRTGTRFGVATIGGGGGIGTAALIELCD